MKVTGLFSRVHLIAAILAGMLISAPVAAKGPTDKFTEQYVQAYLVVGKTTPEQVKSIYGEPTNADRSVNEGGNDQYLRYVEGPKPKFRERLKGLSGGLLSATSVLPDSMQSKLLGSKAGDALYKANAAAWKLQRAEAGVAQITGKAEEAGPRIIRFSFENGVLDGYSLNR